jgi:hypothetical protein
MTSLRTRMSPKWHNITHHAKLDMWIHAYYMIYVETILPLFRTFKGLLCIPQMVCNREANSHISFKGVAMPRFFFFFSFFPPFDTIHLDWFHVTPHCKVKRFIVFSDAMDRLWRSSCICFLFLYIVGGGGWCAKWMSRRVHETWAFEIRSPTRLAYDTNAILRGWWKK